MALIHRAQITPTKAELLAAWLPSRAWSAGAEAPFELLGAYRFDDPAGEVGIETHLVRTARGDVLQAPLTYRAAPLENAGHHLIDTMEHTHLGRRWVYDGCGDPVYVAAVTAAIRTGGREAEEWVEADTPVRREPTARVTGSGTAGPTIDPVPPVDGPTATSVAALVVLRVVGEGAGEGAGQGRGGTLTGTWTGRTEPALLAYLRAGRVMG